MMSFARPPFPSTQALVASVVESAACSARISTSVGKLSSAVAMQRVRSPLVVSDLDEASTSMVSVSTTTASVNVPPVSIPNLIIKKPLPY